MDVMQIISEKQLETSRDNCPYCGTDIRDLMFRTKFELNFHYKELECNCGRKISFKMSWIGSGHDNWNKKNLDTRIEEVE